MDVREKINAGDYDNKLPCPEKKNFIAGYGPIDEYKEAMKDYRREGNRLMEQFKTDVLEEVGLTGHAKADKIYAKAWEDGRSEGLQVVLLNLEDLAELMLML